MTELLDDLAQNELFAALSEADRRRVADRARFVHAREGEFIAARGEVWPYLFYLREGTIDAVKESTEGRSLIVVTLQAGDVFWGLAFFLEGARMPVTLRAEAECQLALWERDELVPILIENGRALWSLCQRMVSRMERASEIVEGLAFQPVAGRLARMLLAHYPETSGEPVARDLTLDEMAARVGTTREMVCRLLYRFADRDLIHITRTEFSLQDKEGLRRVAQRG
jgi:CRP-like cAMP-binding protein